MRYPTGHEVTKLRGDERNFSRLYLGVQRGKERTDTPVPLMVGMHYALVAADAYDAVEHGLTFNAANFLTNSDIRPGMTLAVGTLADPFLYGSARIREVDAGARTLYLEPNNLGAEGYLATGDHVWVDGAYRLYRILPNIVDGEVYEDGNADSAGGAGGGIPGIGIRYDVDYLDRPVALMGSPRFAWTGETIDFYGWRSHGRGGRTIQNWTWDFDGGVCTGPGIGFPGSPASPIHARWNAAGEYIASLVVEDDSGNNTDDVYGVRFDRHRAVRPVLIYDRPGEGDNTPYSDFEVESLTGKYGSGWSCKITVFGTADTTEFPDNALIIVYAEDWYGGEQGSIGGWYGQENILFCGYIKADSITVDFEKSSVSFEAQSIEQWMKDISLWPMNCVDDAAATWHHFNGMTVEDVLWYLAELRSTLKDITDCFFASDVGAEKTLGFVDLTEASLYNQMSEQLGSCFFGQLSASRHGSIHLFKHKNMLDLAERAWWGPPVYSFSRQDWEGELQIGEERQRDSVAQVDFIAFVYDDNGNPLEVYSLAPELQTNFGRIVKVDGILLSGNSIVAGQAESNTLAGLFRAKENIRFPHIRVPTRVNNRVLEPATLDYFAIVLDDTIRGYDWDGKEFLCTGVSVQTDNENGKITVEVEGEASTWGPDGVAGPYPPGPPAEPPADNPSEYVGSWPPGVTPENPDGDPPPWGVDEDGDAFAGMTVYLGLNSGHVIRGTGLGPALGYDCRYHNCGLNPAPTPNIYWMALDQFDLENAAMIATHYRVYKTTNLADDTHAWTQVIPAAGDWSPPNTGEIWGVRSSEVQQDLWMAVGFEVNTAIYVWWSTQGGAAGTWNQRTFAGPGGQPDGSFPYLELSTHDANRAWVVYVDGNDGRTYVAETNDMWATAPSFTVIPAACFNGDPAMTPCGHHRRYDNDDDSVDIFGGTEVSGAPHDANVYLGAACATLYNDGTGWTKVGVDAVGCGVGTRNRWWALAHGETVAGFWVSDGTTWTEQNNIALAVNGLTWYLHNAKNYRANWQWYAITRDGGSNPVIITVDRGVSLYPQWGNWPALTVDEGLGDPDVIMICSPDLLP